MPNDFGKVTIYRDTYGVPHIYGETEEAALFGQGYAAAQDRLHTILKGYMKVEGRTAEVFGPDWVDHDLQVRMSKHAEISQEMYPALSESCRTAVEVFLAGIKHYMAEHPDEVPDWAPELHPWHVIGMSRYAIWSWPVRQAMEKLETLKKELDQGEGSNSWVIGKERSAEGCPIALIDPHVPWMDEWLFFEVHLHGGDLNVFGFNVPGAPYVAIGHNDFVYWTCTTGAPDCSDVYIEELNPDNPHQYMYDGEWRDCEVQHIELKVKTEEGTETIVRDVPWTGHGPIVVTHGNLGASVKLS
ncbi:MAG: penicillin acylase family protein, partial [Planctomycetes bacterium]|nr:penicillin acylase family protein [Planctomycetota bacterium]